MGKPIIILLDHKPLSQKDGQANYVSSIIKGLSARYNVIAPSELLFRKTGIKNLGWVTRTSIVNAFLAFWLLRNINLIKYKTKFIIVEDRYVFLPFMLSIILFRNKILSRVSDWGGKYASQINFNLSILSYIFIFYGKLYESLTVKFSKGIIAPSEFVKQQIIKRNKNAVVFSYIYEPRENNIKGMNFGFLDDEHDIYCTLVGNYDYEPNADAANFILSLATNIEISDRGIKFIIAGHRSKERYGHSAKRNLQILGFVEDLEEVYKKCHIGLNPSTTLGGTSIKNIEYLVNGLFVITTPEAAEGIIESNRIRIVRREDFVQEIIGLANKLRAEPNFDKNEIKRIRQYYSFSKNSTELLKFLEAIYD
ncbi:MAG: glycosyltransferase [Nitrososphaerota archaeon]|nr:glycosyltransferase [Nitrososphaerota archaeon]MDG7049055.1 glycosyltransferase [Nitrososphaerota archaeon]MDG7052119.1 glycosyltransferase [Nitrososphaerota archaeon]